jgi:hypothetical protein
MENEQSTNNQSPWPARADCRISAEEHEPTGEAAVSRTPAKQEGGALITCDGLDPTSELGTRRDAVRREVEEAFARALARAQDSVTKERQPEREDKH